jgi:hypothetical protein
MTINFSNFLRPMPGAVQRLPPPDESQMISDTGDSMVRSIQQGRENDRADQRIALEQRSADLANKREGDYMALQNKMENRRHSQQQKENENQRRAMVADLMNKWTNAKTEEERAVYRSLLSRMVPGFERSRGTASPDQSPIGQPAGQPSPQAAPTASVAPAAPLYADEPKGGVSRGIGMAPKPQGEPAPFLKNYRDQNPGDFEAQSKPSGPDAAALQGDWQRGYARGGEDLAPKGPVAELASVGPGQDQLMGDWQQGYMNPPPPLPGQSRILAEPASFLSRYRRENPEDFAPEDSLQ